MPILTTGSQFSFSAGSPSVTTVWLPEDVSIFEDGYGIRTAGGNTVNVQGTIVTTSNAHEYLNPFMVAGNLVTSGAYYNVDSGIWAEGSSNFITVHDGGMVAATTATDSDNRGFGIRYEGHTYVSNHGTITGSAYGIAASAGAQATPDSIGTISVYNYGLVQGVLSAITNQTSIGWVDDDYYTIGEAGSLLVNNAGVIQGQIKAISDDDDFSEFVSITNSGRITAPLDTLYLASADWTVANTGEILTSGQETNVVNAQESGSLINHGTMMGKIEAYGTLLLSNSGTMSAHSTVLDLYAASEITNTGFITSTVTEDIYGDALFLHGGGTEISNAGEIAGNITTLWDEFSFGQNTLENTGRILGVVSLGDSGDKVLNTDYIRGDVITGNGGDEIINHGHILGDVLAGDMSEFSLAIDQVTNTGRIDGRVVLGEGMDIFDGRGGHVAQGVYGGNDNDFYIVDSDQTQIFEYSQGGNDTVRAFADHVLAEEVENLILGGAQDWRGTGNASDNVMEGNGGDNRLTGRLGNDSLTGGDGDDDLRGSKGNDSLMGEVGMDTLRGGLGADTVVGGSETDRLLGGAGQDSILGEDGDDLIFGGKGNDLLFGGDDDDILVGGRGRDTLDGGTGADVFRFTAAGHSTTVDYDRIADFARGSDLIDLSALDVTLAIKGGFSGSAGSARTAETAKHTRIWIDMNGDGSADMRIDVLNRLGLTAEDFLF